MAFAVSAKNIFSPESRYTQVSNQNGSYKQQVQDPRFTSAAPWTSGHSVYRVTDPKLGTGYIAENRAASGEKAHYR